MDMGMDVTKIAIGMLQHLLLKREDETIQTGTG